MANKISKLDISALILVRNEGQILEDCLKQLDFVREIIVLDQESGDNTIAIAKKYTDKIIKSGSSNFSKNRNTLAKSATCRWLFYLDADERIGDQNISEIKSGIENTQFQAYYFPRKNIVLGKWLKHGGWWPDYVPRLIKKQNLINWFGEVHESPKIEGQFGYFKRPITHLTARSLDQMLNKSIVWAQIEAKLFHDANYPKVGITKVIYVSLREFFKRYIIKMGVLDGTVGAIEAIYQALHQAIVLVYLWEIQNETEEKFKEVTNE
jgi:glycosyltransferase involved in cell wall biosynthesis